MIRISKYRNKIVVIIHSTIENPTSGTLGDYFLLKQDLLSRDSRWEDMESQPVFNLAYLKEMQEKYHILHCAYCNKSPLRVYEFHERGGADKATTDHIFPKSEYPLLARERSNLTIACEKCNGKKGSKLQEIKFPYL
jgi:5-methylcytosine-specific restriction endonuclease McrA